MRQLTFPWLMSCILWLCIGVCAGPKYLLADLDEDSGRRNKPVPSPTLDEPSDSLDPDEKKANALKDQPAANQADTEGEPGDLNEDRRPQVKKTITGKTLSPSPSPSSAATTTKKEKPTIETKSTDKLDQATTTNQVGEKKEVHFSSKGMAGIKEKGMVELIDNVVITQDNMRLESDRAIAYFDEKTDELIRVEAMGNVRINKDDPDPKKKVKATGRKAIFYNADQKLVLMGDDEPDPKKKLKGGDPRLWRGEDLMRGRQITYEIPTGMVHADNVEGVLKPSENNGQTP